MDEIIAAIEAARQMQRERQRQAQARSAPAGQVREAAAPAPVPAPPAPANAPPTSAGLIDAAVQETAARPESPFPVAQNRSLQGMFADGNTVLRAVVASEVLGKPAALRENQLWSLQPSEPSI